jgi:hypothetical protein
MIGNLVALCVYLLGFVVVGRICVKHFAAGDRTDEKVLGGVAFGLLWPLVAACAFLYFIFWLLFGSEA